MRLYCCIIIYDLRLAKAIKKDIPKIPNIYLVINLIADPTQTDPKINSKGKAHDPLKST